MPKQAVDDVSLPDLLNQSDTDRMMDKHRDTSAAAHAKILSKGGTQSHAESRKHELIAKSSHKLPPRTGLMTTKVKDTCPFCTDVLDISHSFELTVN